METKPVNPFAVSLPKPSLVCSIEKNQKNAYNKSSNDAGKLFEALPKHIYGGVFYMKKALIFLAEGFEEIEAVTPLDLLRRAGVDAKFVSLAGTLAVTGSHGVTYQADMLFDEKTAAEADMLILPGGMPGAQHLQDNEVLGKLLLRFHEAGKFVCAICAAPMVLGHLGILQDKKATIYPGMEDRLIGATPVADKVCRDGNVITGRGPGAAVPFALSLIEALAGAETADQIRGDIVFD